MDALRLELETRTRRLPGGVEGRVHHAVYADYWDWRSLCDAVGALLTTVDARRDQLCLREWQLDMRHMDVGDRPVVRATVHFFL